MQLIDNFEAGHNPASFTNKKEKPMKQLLINIFAYDHHAKFEILAEDNAKAVN